MHHFAAGLHREIGRQRHTARINTYSAYADFVVSAQYASITLVAEAGHQAAQREGRRTGKGLFQKFTSRTHFRYVVLVWSKSLRNCGQGNHFPPQIILKFRNKILILRFHTRNTIDRPLQIPFLYTFVFINKTTFTIRKTFDENTKSPHTDPGRRHTRLRRIAPGRRPSCRTTARQDRISCRALRQRPGQLRGGNGNRHPLRGHKTERDDGYRTGTGQRAAKQLGFARQPAVADRPGKQP